MNEFSSKVFYWRKAKKHSYDIAVAAECSRCRYSALSDFFLYAAAGFECHQYRFFCSNAEAGRRNRRRHGERACRDGILLGLGSIIGLPVSIMAGIYLAENENASFAKAVRFLTDVLSGVPSIVVGVVAYMLVVIPMKQFSAIAGGVALGILMIPTATRTTEEMIKLVPNVFREGALALGIPRWKATLRIILPTALKGITTGVLLAIARAAGETAPLIFTALGNRFWSTDIAHPMASLTVFIFDYAKAPFDDWNRQAWGAAFVLIVLIFIVNISFRYMTRDRYAGKHN